MVLKATSIIYKGPKLDTRGLKVSHPLIANMIPFINIGDFLSENKIASWHFRVVHWDPLDDNSLAF